MKKSCKKQKFFTALNFSGTVPVNPEPCLLFFNYSAFINRLILEVCESNGCISNAGSFVDGSDSILNLCKVCVENEGYGKL